MSASIIIGMGVRDARKIAKSMGYALHVLTTDGRINTQRTPARAIFVHVHKGVIVSVKNIK